ncbi:MAG: hypothetical protein ACOY3E_13060 [Pseudomonadota bacterium]
MAHKEQHHNRRDQKKPKKTRPTDHVGNQRASFVDHINANESPQVKP